MGQTLAERIEWEAANDPNRMVSAYAGDLRELMVELTARAERAEAVLGAVPWQTLLNIYECLTLPAVALDGDVDTLASFLNQYAPWVPNESEERDDMEPPNRDFTTTGDFRRARGVIPWLPGDEPAETTIRRLRDAPERAELAEAVVSAIPWQSLLDVYESGKVSDRDDDALGVFLGVYLPAHFYRKSESEE